MAKINIDVRPGDDDWFVMDCSLQKISIRLEFRWLGYLSQWTCQVLAPDNQVLSPAFTVAPGGQMHLDIRDSRVPPGNFYWIGRDPYLEKDLGDTLLLQYEEVL